MVKLNAHLSPDASAIVDISKYKITEKESGIASEIALHKVGDVSKPVVFCVHGLTRNAKDFYPLAEKLAEDYYVLMPDVPGRGESEYFAHPALYNNGMMALLMVELLGQLNTSKVHWIGTSMGGIIGMIVAATKPKLVESLLLNDIGSMIPAAAMDRIKTYVGLDTTSDNYEALAGQVRKNLEPFGIQDPEILEHFVQSSIVEDEGGYRLNYDANIRQAFADWGEGDVDMDELWQAVKCPTLIFRGENSDLLLKETAEQMVARDGVELFEVPNTGHAPSLTTEKEIEKVQQWLSNVIPA